MACGIKLITLLAVCISPVTIMAEGGIHQLAATSRFDSVGTAYTPDGKVKIDIREVHTEVAGAKGPRHLSVLVLFEPESGAFSWRVTDTDVTKTSWNTLQFNDEQAAFLKDGEIVNFRALWYRLFIRAYRGRASSMDDAEAKSLKAASGAIDPLGSVNKGQDVQEVSLAVLGPDFMTPPVSVVPSTLTTKITDVRWDGDKQQWIVTLQARWTEDVTLDADYNLVSMKKVK